MLVVKTTAQPEVAIYDLSGALVASIEQVDQTQLWVGRAGCERSVVASWDLHFGRQGGGPTLKTERRQRVVHLVY